MDKMSTQNKNPECTQKVEDSPGPTNDNSVTAKEEAVTSIAPATAEPGPSVRQRGPTLTIDTHPILATSQVISSPEPKSAASFESPDSRPTSPHNVSSPVRADSWPAFLSVPGLRSRSNSFDSIDSYGTADTANTMDSVISYSRRQSEANVISVIDDKDALKPDPGTEVDFFCENNPFAFSPGQLNKLLNPKSLGAFYALGGLRGLEQGLRTDCSAGLSVDELHLEGAVTFEEVTAFASKQDSWTPPKFSRQLTSIAHATHSQAFEDRKRIFSDGKIPHKRSRSIFRFLWLELRDGVLMLLVVAALTTIAIGVYQAVAQDKQHASFSWPEGTAICTAVAIVVLLGALNDWRKQRHFHTLNEKLDDVDRPTRVLRSGRTMVLSATEIMVGDIAFFQSGDILSADGIFIDGHDVQCDELNATGESDVIKKTKAVDAYNAIENHENLTAIDPFMISNARIILGQGSYLVTATGVHSTWGKISMCLSSSSEGQTETPLQKKLYLLSEWVAKIGIISAILLFIALLIKYLVRLKHDPSNGYSKGLRFLYILTIAVTIVDVAIPSGLPLAQTVSLALATSRMLKNNILVRDLGACETLGYTTSVCLDESGLLSKEPPTAISGIITTDLRCGPVQDDQNSHGDPQISKKEKEVEITDTGMAVLPADLESLFSVLAAPVSELLKTAIAITTTAVETAERGEPTKFSTTSSFEHALTNLYARIPQATSISEERRNHNILKIVHLEQCFSYAAAFIQLPSGRYRMFVRASAEIVLQKSTRILRNAVCDLDTTEMSTEARETLENFSEKQASKGSRMVGIGYKDFDTWPTRNYMDSPGTELKDTIFESLFGGLTFLGIFGFKLSLQPDIQATIHRCAAAGLYLRYITADTPYTARAIAEQAGIFQPGHVMMEGRTFRQLSRRDVDCVIPRLGVLASACPEDTHRLLKRLVELGEKVTRTAHRRDDVDILRARASAVRVSMTSWASDMAKSASGVVILDDRCISLLQAIMWGRALSDSMQKFLQFQLTINVTAVVLTFISSVVSRTEQSVLNSVQLLWVNLIMDLFAILALANDPPTKRQAARPPSTGRTPLITLTMWKMIFGQAVFQLTICLVLSYTNIKILGYDPQLDLEDQKTLVFNTFVWMQIFNQLNSRRVDSDLNIFEGITENYIFIFITTVIVGVQCLLIFCGGKALNTVSLTGPQWGCSIVMGACTLPVGVAIRLFPDDWIRLCIPDTFFQRRSKVPEIISDFDHWDHGMLHIKDELSFTRKIHGGRLWNLQSRFNAYRPRRTSSSRGRDGSMDHGDRGMRSRPSLTKARGRTSASGSVSGMSNASAASGLRRRQASRTHSISSAFSVPGVVAGAVAIASPHSPKRRSSEPRYAAKAMAEINAGSIGDWTPIDRDASDHEKAT
ncbi:plasma membrane calcium [Coniothyrium glycines]